MNWIDGIQTSVEVGGEKREMKDGGGGGWRKVGSQSGRGRGLIDKAAK